MLYFYSANMGLGFLILNYTKLCKQYFSKDGLKKSENDFDSCEKKE